MRSLQFLTKEVTLIDSFFKLHEFQFELKNQYPTIRIYDYTNDQFKDMIDLFYTSKVNSDIIMKQILDNIKSSFDSKKHVYGELYFDARILCEDDKGELFLMSNKKFPWTRPIGILLDKTMFKELFKVSKYPNDIEEEEGKQPIRILEADSINRMFPEWDAHTGVLNNIMVMEKQYTADDVVFGAKEKLETFYNSWFYEGPHVPAFRINKKIIYDIRICNLSLDRYDKTNKISFEEEKEFLNRVEEFKEIKSWKDLPEISSSKYLTAGQAFFGVDSHVSGDVRARISISERNVSLKYWNKEQIAALYVDAALRTHSNFIKDWDKKLNYPNLKQIVICCCPMCLKGKRFPRRSSNFPDNLVYTEEYKEHFNPDEL